MTVSSCGIEKSLIIAIKLKPINTNKVDRQSV